MERFAGAPEALIARFVKHQTDYLDAVAQEARLRNAGQRPTLDEYFRLRRQNGGVFMSFDMSEAALGIDFPEEVLENETFKNIVIAAVDIIGLANVSDSAQPELCDMTLTDIDTGLVFV